ncbi:MAG: GNAT family N-acetyltransferase [Ancalomicrobiaceae bacterium]|nr:GNAT family N-acetyltransferase [Ancalomicrobiaceae bacterium]
MKIDTDAVRIAREHPTAPGVAELIAALDAFHADLYPPESNHGIPIAELAASTVRFFVARMGEAAVGCVAYRLGQHRNAEVKRLYVSEAARGRDLGRRLMQAAEISALIDAVIALRLETGIHNHAALKLYRSLGFNETGPFPPYWADPLSVFMQKLLV